MTPSPEDDLFWMTMALSLAEAAAAIDEVPVGAIIVCQGRLISTGINLRESTRQASAHAEFLAIEEASRYLNAWRLQDCTLYVTLEPCLMCAGAIYQARIPRVVYGARDAKGGALGSLYQLNEDARLNHRYTVVEGVRAESSAALLSGFFKRKRLKV
ncbi:MAG: tRNA adenosine(34) deaminase TadA [Bdellovibrionota bacterium]|nr:MAG: nucleoside deaminase [Pseudomonadota bacterium]